MFFSFASIDTSVTTSLLEQISNNRIDICAINSGFELITNTTVDSANINSMLQIISNASIFICTIASILNQFLNPSVDISSCSLSAASLANATIIFELPHFQIFFGLSATQTATALIINKADLIGLTPSNNNTAESLLVGIINRILGGLDLIQFLHIDFKYWGYGMNANKRMDTVIINLYDVLVLANSYEIPDITTTIDPNKY